MALHKITFVVLTLATLFLYLQYFAEDTANTSPNRVGTNSFLLYNKPVHMSGCQTYEKAVEPEVIYPTVTENFITRLCALEVPPPYGVIALQRSKSEK